MLIRTRAGSCRTCMVGGMMRICGNIDLALPPIHLGSTIRVVMQVKVAAKSSEDCSRRKIGSALLIYTTQPPQPAHKLRITWSHPYLNEGSRFRLSCFHI
jgi:hypothetical protein